MKLRTPRLRAGSAKGLRGRTAGLILSALSFAVGLTVTGASAASAGVDDKPANCRTDQPTFYDITFTVKNNVDIASDGHVWALDDYLQHVQVWRLSAKHYCFKIEYDGTWRSFAGTSYAGTGTIAEGLTGTWHGLRYVQLTGEFNPQYPTSGHVADFDLQCDSEGVCPGKGPSFAMYFSPVYAVGWVWDDFFAASDTSDDTIRENKTGLFGDITG
jgi:hypothetical protein